LLVGFNALVEDLHGARAHGLEERLARANVVSAPIRIRIFSSGCHFPSRASRAPISKYRVAISNALAMPDHSSR
jgi:hypothetical protein